MIRTVINVPAPRPQVFHALTDYPRYREWVPGCEQCNIVSQSGNSAETRIIMNAMKRIELGLRFEAQPTQTISFRMVKGKDLKSYSGTYRLMDAADGTGTVVIAELDIEVGMMVPKFVVDRVARKMMDETGAALRKHLQTARMPTGARAEAKRAAEAKRRRARKILRVTKTSSGYRVWLLGETFTVKA